MTAVETDVRPALTNHARQRAGEMGIPTKRVKAVLRNPDLIYPSGRELHAVGDGLCVPFQNTHDGLRLALTVLWREDFTR